MERDDAESTNKTEKSFYKLSNKSKSKIFS